MEVTVHPGRVAGTVAAPPSKSYTHRAILAGGYAEETRLHAPLDSADTRATADAVSAFGGSVTWEGDTVTVGGFDGDPKVPADVIDCANSGTTTRLATATAALVDGTTVITGDASLRTRPQGPLLDAITQLGGTAESTRDNGCAPLVVTGPIDGGSVAIPGDVSSQFVTALLFAGAATQTGIEIGLTTSLRSAPYVDITRDLLDAFGVTTTATTDGYHVGGDQSFTSPPAGYHVPGDFSSISYLGAAAAVAGDQAITIEGAHPSAQGDTAIVDILAEMGATVDWDRDAGTLRVTRAPLTGITVSVADTPDLLPTIAVLGAVAEGTTRITDCEHVRYKETDRVAVMADRLRTMGATVDEREAELLVHGDETTLTGTHLDGAGDHRIVMALAVAALAATGPSTITGAEDVAVSFPGYFEALAALGASVEEA
ncbi:MAG: 3-phosphoshikimate 1-carboxyvinyltransferase [Halobacteriaceae archaeon]